MKLIVLIETDRFPHGPPVVYVMPDHITLTSVKEAFKRQELDKVYTVHEVSSDMLDVAPTAGILAKYLRGVEDEASRDALAMAKKTKKKLKKIDSTIFFSVQAPKN